MLKAPKQKGQGLTEYALILVLVSVIVEVILITIGPRGQILVDMLLKYLPH
jgi:pilus assembly protein Flp/PilA